MATGRTPVALSIAGSDSGGGAGIQADLKAFAACGVHGATAIVALTAQNTVEVTEVMSVPPGMIAAQVDAVTADLGVDSVKVGMLGDLATATAVADALGRLPSATPVVVDPVMVAESGATLLEPEAVEVLVARILPRATVITPNLPEARALVASVSSGADQGQEGASQEELARELKRLGPSAVVVTGGHTSEGKDLFFDGGDPMEIGGPVHRGRATHGSGCTHSSALAAGLALGLGLVEAAHLARGVAADAVVHGLEDVGAGAGPVDALDVTARRKSPRT